MTSALKEVIRICSLENASKVLRLCAYDSDFTPNQYDNRFKRISKGIKVYAKALNS